MVQVYTQLRLTKLLHSNEMLRPCDGARNMASTSSSAQEPLWNALMVGLCIETFSAHELVVLEYCFTAFLKCPCLVDEKPKC